MNKIGKIINDKKNDQKKIFGLDSYLKSKRVYPYIYIDESDLNKKLSISDQFDIKSYFLIYFLLYL